MAKSKLKLLGTSWNTYITIILTSFFEINYHGIAPIIKTTLAVYVKF